MSYVYQPYPKAIYHRTLPARVVRSIEEHEAMGAEWAETPAAFADPDVTVTADEALAAPALANPASSAAVAVVKPKRAKKKE